MRALTGFIPLHVKSHFSIGLGTASIAELVQHAGRLGFPALALTDLENLSGQVRFHAACRALGIEPITGVELRASSGPRDLGTRRGRVVLLAADDNGYTNLCQIVTQRRTSPIHMSSPIESLQRALAGLFVLTDAPELLAPLAELAGRERVRALVVRPSAQGRAAERALRSRARALGIALAADLDVELLEPSQRDVQRLAHAVRLQRRVDDPALERASGERVLAAPGIAEELFADLPGAVAETTLIAQSCGFDLARYFARAAHPGRDEQVRAALEQRCRAALAERPEASHARYRARLAAELDLIQTLGYSDLFASVAAVADRARQRAVPIAARGSAVSSLTLHLLGVSSIDPLVQGLCFERFVSAARRTPPDIDIDVSSRRRDELARWLIATRGAKHTLRLASVVAFRARSAHRAGLKALGAPAHVIEAFSRRFPPDELEGHERWTVPEAALPSPWRQQLQSIRALAGMPRQLAQHPGGIALAPAELSSGLPLEQSSGGPGLCQYDAESLNRLGIPKIDLLGNHCLDEIEATLDSLASRAGRDARLELGREPPLDDPNTLELIDAAQTIGCYQIESPALRSVLASMPVQSFRDLIHALAIVRPGPASGHAKELFIARARGEAEPAGPSSALSRLLPATHGVLLFEEDIALLLAHMTGISLAEAEALRVRVGERDAEPSWLQRAGQRFLRAARERGFPGAEAEEVWVASVRFARYAFNKAHAASQALLAYRAAYYKCHAPLDFGCALLNHHGGLYPRRVLAAELARRKVRVLPPSLLHSELECRVEALAGTGIELPAIAQSPAAIRVGLALLQGLRAGSRERLLRTRRGVATAADAEELLRAARLRPRELRALVWSGACDAGFGLAADDYPWVHEVVLQRLEGVRAETLDALIAAARAARPTRPPELVERYSRLCRLQGELRHLKMHLSDHPLRVLRSEAERHGCVPSHRLHEHAGRDVRFAGVVAAARRVPVTSRDVAQFLSFEDEHGLVEARLAPQDYDRLHPRITTPGPFLVFARVSARHGVVQLAVRDLIPFHQRAELAPGGDARPSTRTPASGGSG